MQYAHIEFLMVEEAVYEISDGNLENRVSKLRLLNIPLLTIKNEVTITNEKKKEEMGGCDQLQTVPHNPMFNDLSHFRFCSTVWALETYNF